MYKVLIRYGDNNGLEAMKGDYLSCFKCFHQMRESRKDAIVREDDEHFVYQNPDGTREAIYLVSCEPASKRELICLYDDLSNRFMGKVNRIAKANLSQKEIDLVNNLGIIECGDKTTIRDLMRTLRQYLKIK